MMKIAIKLICIAISFVLHTSLLNAQITVTTNTNSIGRYDIYELTIQHPQSYSNNWEDVNVTAVFSGPQTINIDGFYYNTNIWKIRFAPPQTGSWTYAITFSTPSNTYTASGSFNCIPSTTKGFLRQHPNNPFRLIYPDGTLFNGIGIGDCFHDWDKNGTPHDNWGYDGDFRPAGQHDGRDTTLEVYMNAYGVNEAGFNLFRWSIDNCAFNLYYTITTTSNNYLVQQGMWGDSLVQSLRKNGIRLWTTFFGFNPPFPDLTGNNSPQEIAIERYIRYVVARYGAYTDIWELYNEATTPDHWIYEIVPYLNSIDPYNRLVTVSWEKPNLSVIDINAPHWYEKESEFVSDQRAWEMITSRKSWNKPIIFGEQGNSVQNWDSRSALRMRIRSWTTFFAEGMFIFWNLSGVKDYFSGAANIYLGPEERRYIRAMQNFTSHADTAIQQITIIPSNPSNVRAYGLQSPKIIMGYFHHYSSHTSNITTSFNLALSKAGIIYWINPANDSIIQTSPIGIGIQNITSPAFNIDLAMRIDLETITATKNTFTESEINIYPNPVNTELKINFQSNTIFDVEIFNTLGKTIIKTKIKNTIDISQLVNGIYYLKLKDGSNHYSQKFIKQ